MDRYRRRSILVIGKEFWLSCLVFLLMFVSNDTYLFGTNSNYRMTTVPWYLMTGFIVIIGFAVFSKHMDKRQRCVLNYGFVFILIFAALALYHREYMQVTLPKILCIVSAMLFAMKYRYEEYEEAFIRVMVFNAITALILELIVYASRGLAASLPRMTNTASVQITTIGLAGIDSRNLSSMLVRNGGIFWEPGVFQMYLNLALMMELFRRRAIRMRYVFLLSLGVLITFSTTGFIVYAWILAAYILLSRKNRITVKTLASMSAVLIALVALLNTIDISAVNTMVFGKLYAVDSGSTIARKASVFVNLQLFMSRPLTGVGMKNIQNELVRRSLLLYGRFTSHNTNTLLYQFAAFGLIYGGLFSIGTYKFTRRFSDKLILRIALMIGLVLIYVGENLRTSMLPYLLIFYGYSSMEAGQDVLTQT